MVDLNSEHKFKIAHNTAEFVGYAREKIERLYANVETGRLLGMPPESYRNNITETIEALKKVERDIEEVMEMPLGDVLKSPQSELWKLGLNWNTIVDMRREVERYLRVFDANYVPLMRARYRVNVIALIFTAFVLFGIWVLKYTKYIA